MMSPACTCCRNVAAMARQSNFWNASRRATGQVSVAVAIAITSASAGASGTRAVMAAIPAAARIRNPGSAAAT
jgi:hypothetical protein